MAIKKADLKDFVTQRIGEKIDKEQKLRKQAVKTAVTKYVRSYYDINSYDNTYLHQLQEDISFFIGQFEQSYRIPALYGAKSALEQMTERGLKTYLIDTLTQNISMGVHLKDNELSRSINNATSPHDRKVSELRKLEEELLKVISANRTGDKAYKQLVELGVDLEGFKKEELQLPSVVKIDADVSLF
ncbi:hypothetical protein phi18_178 [Bacillus phage phi18]|nr:hypothetical protein phi18_178 [Bacillus phage phi18]